MRLPYAIQKHVSSLYYRKYESAPHLYRHFRTFKANESKSLDELLHLQIEYLRRLLRHAYEHTKYYRRVFDESGFDPNQVSSVEELQQLPVLTKTIIETEFENLRADTLSESDYHCSYTGGTRGKKTRFLRDNECRAKRLALQWRSDTWAGWNLHEKVAYVWPAFQDVGFHDEIRQYLIEEYLKRSKMYYSGSLSELNAQAMYESLRRYKPTCIRCFPTPAAFLADCLNKHGLTVPGITAVVSTGEPIDRGQATALSTAFDAEVFNLYASRETGTIAAECACHDSLHIAVDSVIVQVEQGDRFCANANEGNLLITDLHNYAMPLIRYEIGDFGVLLENTCSCNLRLPLMRNVVGRLADGFWDREHHYISPLALGNMMEVSPDKRVQAQLIQEQNYDIVIQIAKTSHPDRPTVECICSRLKKVFGENIGVRCELVNEIRPEPSGKYRFSVCKVADGARGS